MKKQSKRTYGTGRAFLTGMTLLLLMVTGCDNATSPNQDLTSSNDAPVSMNSGDAVNTGHEAIYTTEGFYFLAPMVKDSEYSGTFDGGLSPVVEICETTACAGLHASFDMNGDGSEQVRVVEEDEHYIVNWSAKSSGAEAGQTYRVRVTVNGLTLGYADVNVVKNGREANQLRSQGEIAIVANQTLPVKFRIEAGIVGAVVVTPAEASIEVGATQQFSAELFDLRGEPLSGPAVMWSSDDTSVADIDANGLATGKSVGQAVITVASGPATGSAFLLVIVAVESKFFLADNGVTIRCPDALPGEKGLVGGVEYEAVSVALLRLRRSQQRANPAVDLSRLCTTAVTSMGELFTDNASFNQNISSWDTGNVGSMSRMFEGALSFNRDIGDWNTAKVTTMRRMFFNAASFNQDISSWDTGNVTDMISIFNSAVSFNQDLSGWNTGNVTLMSGMFAGATAFNQPIGGWDTGNVRTMPSMFAGATAFNQPIGGWNTSNVTDMRRMFLDAISFNQNLSGWCVSNIISEPTNFDTGAKSWVLESDRPNWGSCPI